MITWRLVCRRRPQTMLSAPAVGRVNGPGCWTSPACLRRRKRGQRVGSRGILPVAGEVDEVALQGIAALEFGPVGGVEVDAGVGPCHGEVAGLARIQARVDEIRAAPRRTGSRSRRAVARLLSSGTAARCRVPDGSLSSRWPEFRLSRPRTARR